MLAHVDFKLGLMHWLSRRPSGHFSHNHSGDIDIFETPIGHSTFYKVLQIFLPLVIPFLDAPFKIHVFPTTGFVSFARSEWECWFIIMLYPFFVFFQDFISFLAVILYFPSRPMQASEHLTIWPCEHLTIWAYEHEKFRFSVAGYFLPLRNGEIQRRYWNRMEERYNNIKLEL